MIDDALARAKELDAHFAKHKKIIGPLHGVPISTKEHIWHKGRVASGGYVAQVNKIASEDSHLVRLAKNAGAVFHLRTNEPQTLMVKSPEVSARKHKTVWFLTEGRLEMRTTTSGGRP